MWNQSSRCHEIVCKRCGTYRCSQDFLTWVAPKGKSHLLSGLLREKNEKKLEPAYITTLNVAELLDDFTIPQDEDIEAKSRKLLAYLKRESGGRYGSSVSIKSKYDCSVAYAADENELFSLLMLLNDSGYLFFAEPYRSQQLQNILQNDPNLILSAKGWNIARSSLGDFLSPQGFIAIQFDKKGKSDPMAMHIAKAIQDCGYTPQIIDYPHGERIMDKAIAEIRKSHFIVADLSGDRSAVTFEAGFAHALGLEVIYVCNEQDHLKNFYAKHYQCYSYSSSEELYERVKDAIAARVGAPLQAQQSTSR